ncbi:MAG TPA: Gfo/Idh/MocA family oxidoreductase [Rhodothermales bacterium]|nr:Gfo/Idh/MocA family oxidoreductase [Rhodothermales bacterium]
MAFSVSSDTGAGPLKAGIIGAGLMGHWHADAAVHAGASISAVCDVDADAAGRLAQRYGAVVSTSLEELLTKARPDVLHICTPLETHVTLAEEALGAGVHLLVEKPLTCEVEQTAALLERALESGLLVCPVHQFVFQDGVRKMLSSLDHLGRLMHFEATFCSAGGLGRNGAFLDAVVADILPHPLSLMQAFLPEGCAVDEWHTVHPRPGEFQAVGVQHGVTVSIRISMNSRPTTTGLRLYGTRGTAHLNLFHGYGFFEPGHVSRARKVVHPFEQAFRSLTATTTNMARRVRRWEPAYPGLRTLVDRFYRAVRHEAPSPLDPEDVLAVARGREQLIERAGLFSRV